MPEPKQQTTKSKRGGRNRRNKKFQKPKVSDVTDGMKQMGMKNKAPKAPQAKANVPAAKTFTPEQTALRNLLSEVVTKCNGKQVEDDGTSAIEQFTAALTTAELVVSSDVTSMIVTELLKNKSGAAREAGCKIVTAIATKLGESVVPSLFAMSGIVLALCGDKKAKGVRESADVAANAVFEVVPAPAVPVFVKRFILEGDESGLADLARFQTKVTSLKLLSKSAKQAPREIESLMTTLVPIISDKMWDTRKQVKVQAADTLEDVCDAIDNIDLEPFIPSMVEAIEKPDTVADCVYALAGTTFVQTVTASALSITCPILERGFKEPKTAIKRKCAVITENMAKLVKNPADVAPFLPLIEPLLEHGLKTISDPECRKRFEKAHETLLRVSKKGKEAEPVTITTEDVLATLKKSVKTTNTSEENVVGYVADVATAFCNVTRNAEPSAWKKTLTVALKTALKGDEAAASKAIEALRVYCSAKCGIIVGASDEVVLEDDDDNDPTPDLCDLMFSLAYGSNILLNNSRLHLKKGYKYGIIASKSAGKTTMMRAISNGQVEGFPSSDEVRTIFIENDIQGSQMEMNTCQYLVDTVGFGIKVTEAEARQILLDNGFNEVMCSGLITQLSGGWKMKLALIRATMQKADIMLMDEPTNHLDVLNVQWVVDYINSLPHVTCLMVSHDTAFMDKTIDHIVHFQDLKLNTYKGNVTAFVKRFPEAKSYFELGSTDLEFKFPLPGMLDGVRSKGAAIMSMTDIDFTYPGAAKPQLTGVTARLSMASRVAIVGANGAGKSTMIKLLTGELKPSTGLVKKHPNCRFAYVAQHAFHHIEQHLDKSPNEYIRWRYEGGEDKEARQKATAQVSPEEQKKMDKPFEVSVKLEDGSTKKEKRVVKKLMARRKVKKEYHYEVNWKGKTMDDNSWYPRDMLEKRGFLKWMKALDARLSASQAMGKPLTARNVEEHLGNVGLESEHATHSRIRDLSGGQKVKVVLAACTWSCPHVIILDEPTNYLDRDSLGALKKAIDNFEGGVCLITHNKEFADATTRVTWVVANNKLDIKGDAEWEKYAAEQELIQQEQGDTMTDAMGNTVKIKKIKKIEEMSRSEIKKNKKLIKGKIKNGEDLEEHEQDWADEWNIDF